MTRYTVSLSKAKSYARRKRAQKAMNILKEEITKREGEEFSISQEINNYIWDRGAENPPNTIEVNVVEQDGEKVVTLPESEAEPERPQQQSSQPTSQGDSDRDNEYKEALDGTVGEAKDRINDLDDPDYERILELEEQGKDRKTLKEFLESKVE